LKLVTDFANVRLIVAFRFFKIKRNFFSGSVSSFNKSSYSLSLSTFRRFLFIEDECRVSSRRRISDRELLRRFRFF
jgi:hypothetical protein